METIYWSDAVFGEWELQAAATEHGLCWIEFDRSSLDSLQRWAASAVPGAVLVRDEEKLAPYLAELREYIAGERISFTAPLDLRGTAFQRKVWEQLREIPYGATCSYADIALAIGSPKAVRAVGGANGRNPVPIIVPCHRVIGKNGTLTGYSGGLHFKERLLKLEREGAGGARAGL
ncbi:methylated-DNA--[protein]-cysteine S-methyltransferase [Paenibacillus turpanensis]|uniref:methylated-DNA--[protein]-cysteine S-methyltransferase n=1 Tax=Paenibacillus turpanensis TaxID=2689078 RepID=UPI001407BF04